MAVVLRKLSQKRHWDDMAWLEQGDTQADVVKCLSPMDNRLSVYMLDHPARQVDRVVAALALTRDHLAHMDLAVIPDRILEDCRIQRASNEGDTPDPAVNEWHLDLVELSVAKIARFAGAIKAHARIERFNCRKVAQAIGHSVTSNFIGKEYVSKEMAQSLKRRNVSLRLP